METVKMGNRGYAAEVLVVTYDRKTKHDNEKSKFRILMVSSMNCFMLEGICIGHIMLLSHCFNQESNGNWIS